MEFATFSGGLASGALAPGRPGYAMRPVRTADEWRAVRELRLAALRGRGDIAPETWALQAERHDAAPNATTFVLERDARPLGSIRASVRSAHRPSPLPAMDAFARELDGALGAAATVVEASLAVIDPHAADPTAALLRLFKGPMLACVAQQADWLIAAVRDAQMGFFRRVLDMEILSGAETLPGLASPRVLMGLRFREQAPFLFRRIPVLAVTAADERRFAATGTVPFEAAIPT